MEIMAHPQAHPLIVTVFNISQSGQTAPCYDATSIQILGTRDSAVGPPRGSEKWLPLHIAGGAHCYIRSVL